MSSKMVNLDRHRIECDEIWVYIGKKEKHLRTGDDPQLGNVWTWCALEPESKVVPTFKISAVRDTESAQFFTVDLVQRTNNRVQISTDGIAACVLHVGPISSALAAVPRRRHTGVQS